MFIINRNIQQQRYIAFNLMRTATAPIKNNQLVQARTHQLSIWTIPKIVLATTNKSNRRWIVGTLGAASILSSLFGPVVWVAAGGAASIVTWRLFQKTKSWWNHLAPVISSSPSSSNNSINITPVEEAILSQIFTHRAAELVRIDAIKQLKHFFEETDQGKQMLEAFGLDHPHELVWEDVHRSEAVILDNDKSKHQVKVNFWLKDQISAGPKGGGCEVTAAAIVSGQGKIHLDQVKLSAPVAIQTCISTCLQRILYF